MTIDEMLSRVREDLKPYVVAVKEYKEGEMWNQVGHRTIANAQNEYDAGYCDIVHQRMSPAPGGAFAMLAIPRKERADIKMTGTFWAARNPKLAEGKNSERNWSRARIAA